MDELKTEGRWKIVPSGLGRWKKRKNIETPSRRKLKEIGIQQKPNDLGIFRQHKLSVVAVEEPKTFSGRFVAAGNDVRQDGRETARWKKEDRAAVRH